MTVTFEYGGVGFVADFTMTDIDEWIVDEIYPDVSGAWAYRYGLWDLLRDEVRDAADDAVSEYAAEAWATRHGRM